MSRLLPVGRLFVFCVAISTLALRPCIASADAPAGTYLGLIDADGPLASGSIQIVLSRGGQGSLSVRLGNQPPVVAKVTVDANGQIVAGLLPGGLTLDLFLLPQADGSATITGDLLMPNYGAQINLAPRASAATAAEAAGRYTLQFDHAAAGVDALMGVATVVVSPNGAARLVSGLSDGTVLSQGGTLDSNGNLLLFQGHPAAHSTFQMQANFAADGSVAGSGKAITAAGTETSTIRGTRFVASANFGLPSSGTLSTSSTVDPTAVVTATGLTSPPRLPAELRVAGVVPANLRLDVRTGFATGDYTVTVAGKRVVRHLSGAVFQDRNATVGFVTQGTRRVGEFELSLDGLATSALGTTAGSGSTTTSTTTSTGTTGAGVSGGTLSLVGNNSGGATFSAGYNYSSGATLSLDNNSFSGGTAVNSTYLYANSGALVVQGNPVQIAIQHSPLIVAGSPMVFGGTINLPQPFGVATSGAGAVILNNTSASVATFIGAGTVTAISFHPGTVNSAVVGIVNPTPLPVTVSSTP